MRVWFVKCSPLERCGLAEAFQRIHDLRLDGQISGLHSVWCFLMLFLRGKERRLSNDCSVSGSHVCTTKSHSAANEATWLRTACNVQWVRKILKTHSLPGSPGSCYLPYAASSHCRSHMRIQRRLLNQGLSNHRPLRLWAATCAQALSWDLTKHICSSCRDAEISSPFQWSSSAHLLVLFLARAGVRGTQAAAGAACLFIALALSLENPPSTLEKWLPFVL